MKKRWALFLIFVFLFLFSNYLRVESSSFQGRSGNVTIRAVVPGCGDGIIGSGEHCDGTNLAGLSCLSFGFARGTLSCTASCTFDTSACFMAPPPPPVGGGGVGIVTPLPTGVRLSGRAFPNRTITVLKDAQVAAVTIADANANFQVSVTGISAGNYIFSVYSEDHRGIRSSLLTFPVSVITGVIANIGGIFIAPSIDTDKSEVRRGDNIAIFGQSAPNSEITIMVSSDVEFFQRTRSDQSGIYLYNFNTAPLYIGQHFTKSKAAIDGSISAFGRAVNFTVGARNVRRVALTFLRGDLNADGRVNLVDFSIGAFWHNRRLDARFAETERERLNGDGRINLVDFSIIAFHWTG